MEILNYDEVMINKKNIIESIVMGSVFIHPTDTIYGLGCNAQNPAPVKKIRRLKGRAINPFSVIAPSLGWILENCIITKDAKEWLKKLPGPYTLILKLKNENCIAKEVNFGLGTLGVRMPSHWIKELVAESKIPVVTTSVNMTQQSFMTSLDDLDGSIKSGLDFAIYEGKKEGKPSRIIDLTGKVKVIER